MVFNFGIGRERQHTIKVINANCYGVKLWLQRNLKDTYIYFVIAMEDSDKDQRQYYTKINMEKKSPTVERLLKNMGNMHELGRQRAFELGTPFYGQFKEDGGYWRKEMPTGETYLVTIEVIFDENDMPVQVKDTIIKQLE